MKTVATCPVCMGNGLVPDGFYSQTSGNWLATTAEGETCRSCDGKGYILFEDENIVIKNEMKIFNNNYVRKVIIPELIKALENNNPKTNLKNIIGIY